MVVIMAAGPFTLRRGAQEGAFHQRRRCRPQVTMHGPRRHDDGQHAEEGGGRCMSVSWPTMPKDAEDEHRRPWQPTMKMLKWAKFDEFGDAVDEG